VAKEMNYQKIFCHFFYHFITKVCVFLCRISKWKCKYAEEMPLLCTKSLSLLMSKWWSFNRNQSCALHLWPWLTYTVRWKCQCVC